MSWLVRVISAAGHLFRVCLADTRGASPHHIWDSGRRPDRHRGARDSISGRRRRVRAARAHGYRRGIAVRNIGGAHGRLCLRFREVGSRHLSLGRRGRCRFRGFRSEGVRRSDRRPCRSPRPTKIVGPPPLWGKRFAAAERARHKRIGGCRARSSLGAQQLATAAGRNRQRNDGAGERTSLRTAAKRSRLQWQCDGRRPIGKRAQDFPFHIVSELAGSESGEIDSIARAQPPDLTFEVRPLRGIPSSFINESVPNVDVADVR